MNVRLIMLVALLSVSAAASAKRYEAPMPLAQDLQVEVVLNQQELGVDVPATASSVGAQFGLLGALVGSAITAGQVANAEKRVAEIRNVLVDYRFNENFERQLRAKLASEGISPNPQFTFMATPWDAYSATKAGKVAADGVLIITPRYSITNNFEVLKVSLSARFVNRTFKPNGKMKEKNLLMSWYSFQFPMTKLDGSFATEDAQRWIDLGPQEMQGLLDQGITQVVDMMVYEFSPEGRQVAKTKTKAKNTFLKGKPYWGWSLREAPDWIWLREWGVAGITGYYPVDGMTKAAAAAATVVDSSAAESTATDSAEAASIESESTGTGSAAVGQPVAGAVTDAVAVPEPVVAEAAPASTEDAAPVDSAAPATGVDSSQ